MHNPVIEIKNYNSYCGQEELDSLGKKYADILRTSSSQLTIVTKTLTSFMTGEIPFNGSAKVRKLYFDGKHRATMVDLIIPGEEVAMAGKSVISRELNELIDGGSYDPYPLFETETLEMLDELTQTEYNTLCFWDKLLVHKGDRGKGFAEILMLQSLNDAYGEGEGIHVLLVSHWGHPTGEERNEIKQKSLNRYYKRFLSAQGFSVLEPEEDRIVAGLSLFV
ncbi:MAG: hypothetical protein JXQ77_05615 [Campylobacterales bacterium]|nr:hypothetical protein [Campylobacterales bacterium]